jgi:hypothetical protein
VVQVKSRRGAGMSSKLMDLKIFCFMLAASMADKGLLHPVVIRKDFVLVAGERRIAAAKSLGWTDIRASVVDNLEDAVRAKEIVRKAEREPEKYGKLIASGLPGGADRGGVAAPCRTSQAGKAGRRREVSRPSCLHAA